VVFFSKNTFRSTEDFMAGLGLFDQKSGIAVTMPIVTAFKFCIGHRKKLGS
jgi:hypothetical protein